MIDLDGCSCINKNDDDYNYKFLEPKPETWKEITVK